MISNEYSRRVGKIVVSSTFIEKLKKKATVTDSGSITFLEEMILNECRKEIADIMDKDCVTEFRYTKDGALLAIKCEVEAICGHGIDDAIRKSTPIVLESPMGLIRFCICLNVVFVDKCEISCGRNYTISSAEGYEQFITEFRNCIIVCKTLLCNISNANISNVRIADECRANGARIKETSDVVDITNIFCELRKGRLMYAKRKVL